MPQNADIINCMQFEWENNPRWRHVVRPYYPEDVLDLRRIKIQHTYSNLAARQLWEDLQSCISIPLVTLKNQLLQYTFKGARTIHIHVPSSMTIMRICDNLKHNNQVCSIITHNDFEPEDVSLTFDTTTRMIRAGIAGIVFDHPDPKSIVTARLAADVCAVPLVLITTALSAAGFADVLLLKMKKMDFGIAEEFAKNTSSILACQYPQISDKGALTEAQDKLEKIGYKVQIVIQNPDHTMNNPYEQINDRYLNKIRSAIFQAFSS